MRLQLDFQGGEGPQGPRRRWIIALVLSVVLAAELLALVGLVALLRTI